MKVIDDSFAFKEFQAELKSKDDLLRTSTLDLVDAFYGAPAAADLLPWDKLHGLFDLRPCEVTLWPGINGHGKTLVTTQVAFHLAAMGKKVAIVSLEMRPVTTLARMARQVSGTSQPTEAWLKGFQGWCDDRIFLMGVQGIVRPQRVIDFAYYAARKVGCTHIVIDNLTKVIRDEGDSAAMKGFVDDLCTIARDTRCHIHLVCHTRKGESEMNEPDKADIRGSSSVADQTDNIVAVFRRKKKEIALANPKLDPIKRGEIESEPDTLLIVQKQRNGDWEGRCGLYLLKDSLWFNCAPKKAHPLPQLFDLPPSPDDTPEVPF